MTSFDAFWNKYRKSIIEFRRTLHRYPEPALKEYRTSSIIRDALKNREEIDIRPVEGTGLVAILQGNKPGPVVALRAEMDGLEITERTGLEYRSRNKGYMHACGHDAHMAILLGTLHYLAKTKNKWEGSVLFVFQPAEEKFGGARLIMDSGLLKLATSIAALHLWPDLPEGIFGIREGMLTATNDYFRITVRGRTAHAALPEDGIDALYTGSRIINELKSLVGREISPLKPALIHIGTFRAGDNYNVIADRAVLKGTVRTTDPETNKFLEGRIPALARRIGALYGARIKVEYIKQYPSVVNSPMVTEVIRRTAKRIFGPDQIQPLERPAMIAEDFSFYTERIPGAMIFLGTRSPEKGFIHGLHNSRFNFDEELILSRGIRLLGESARALLKEKH